MAKQKPNLAAALSRNKEPETPAPAKTPQARTVPKKTSARAPSREGAANISGYFPLPVKYTLEELRLKRARELGRRVTVQELMGEAFNELFKKYGLPEVAPVGEDG